ncbi:MAG TPA: lysophospholipid acyltransferase family protein [Gammaproteobacteria bacterium]|nr:lysophospholipid acyltransferase family protein [Gammaproteobacteria bacterium]
MGLRLCLAQIRPLLVIATVAVPAAWISICLPKLRHRRAFARRAARVVFTLAGMPLTVEHLDRLPPGPCVIVANHSSYLDGVVLMAALPPRFTFLIKEEINAVPLVGLLLRRLGMAFVSRTDPKAAAGAAARLIRAAKKGNAIGVFPEGTFRREPGLRSFRLGAFLAAARTGLPVAPVTIRGTRYILPAGNRYLRQGPIRVTVLPAIVPAAPDREAAELLRKTARRAIVDHCGEPDI